MRLRDKQSQIPTFELACRTGYMAIMIAIPSALDPAALAAVHGWYFFWCLLGTLTLMAATYPLGHSPLGADLRGIIGFALAFEALTLFSYVGVKSFYVLIEPNFQAIEYGFWAALVGRMVWPYSSVGWPRFDFMRFFTGGLSSHSNLSILQKISGYLHMSLSFFAGMWLGYCKIDLNYPLFFAIPGVILLISARRDFADISDR